MADMDYGAMPEEVRLGSQRQRIDWHAERVRRELPVFDFFDWLDSGLVPDEIRGRLATIRRRIARVETKLAELEQRRESQERAG